MNFYIIGIGVFVIVFIVCIFILLYLIKDEKKLAEVSSQKLIQLGKVYTKDDFESKMFEQYANILSNITYENYEFLKDAVSDELYNQILLTAKKNRENGEESIVQNIKKEFSKLISFEISDDLEIAKLWVRYSSIEYIKGIRKTVDENGKESLIETVVDGNKDQPTTHEYILTFVKNRTQNENVVCPSCGFQTHILTSSKCIQCDSEIIPKRMHWVFVEKISTNISNQK